MKKTDIKNSNKSLVGSTAEETQQKEGFVKSFFRIFVAVCLFLILIFSFISVFLRQNYIAVGDKYLIGVINSNNYYDVKSCDLIKVKAVNDEYLYEEDDVVIYKFQNDFASGRFVNKVDNLVSIQKDDEQIININSSVVIGVQVGKLGVLGLFVWFFTSIYGAFTTLFMTYVYVLALTFGRINYENSKYGKYLLSEYKKWKKEQKLRKKLAKIKVNIEEIDKKYIDILKGSFDENAMNFCIFKPQVKMSFQEKYKMILFNVHEATIEKNILSNDERRIITSVIELLGQIMHIDGDIEYMLVDLILKTKLVNFEYEKFVDSISSFLGTNISKDDFLNLCSVCYVLIKKNKRMLPDNAKNLVHLLVNKAKTFDDDIKKVAEKLAI